ncbi:MAG: hypothetical protein A2Y10_20480 [Planctomycetes bacterium GWF2_41_51]|nr:MAG: hypothetical protein A2Y10_20480 [Planctomycetes bacterium GWF2_41_51]
MKTEKHNNAKIVIPLGSQSFGNPDRFAVSNRSRKAFTLIEVLTAVVIIAILVGILIPALNMVRKIAKDTQQKAQIASIEIGLSMYKNEDTFGDYPPSVGSTGNTYCGAQTLTEAMLGQDLLGVDPNTEYKPNELGGLYADANDRKGPYLDRTHISVLTPDHIFNSVTTSLEKDMYVICDVYSAVKKSVTFSSGSVKKVNISTPILYYRADTSKTTTNDVYDFADNKELTDLGAVSDGRSHEIEAIFYNNMIEDPMLTNRPLRPDSFLLISAGNDGLYGTSDDICNFEPNIE